LYPKNAREHGYDAATVVGRPAVSAAAQVVSLVHVVPLTDVVIVILAWVRFGADA
jgi:hypothetical protein